MISETSLYTAIDLAVASFYRLYIDNYSVFILTV